METEHDIVIEFKSFIEFNADAGTINDLQTLSALQHLTKYESEWENPKYFNFPEINLNILKALNKSKNQDYLIFPISSDYEFTIEEVSLWVSEVEHELSNGEGLSNVVRVLALVEADSSLVFLELDTKVSE